METGTLIEFKVTPELLNQLGEFIAKECQMPQVQASTFGSQELIGMHLRECQAKTRQAIRRLLTLLQSQGVKAIDSGVVEAIERLKLCAKANPSDAAIRDAAARWLAPQFPGINPDTLICDHGDTTAQPFPGSRGVYIEQLGITAWVPV